MKINYKNTDELEKAGLANLEYANIERPVRRKSVITMPKKGYELFQLTHDMSQFLLLSEKPLTDLNHSFTRYKAWFGGTDEQPFLVELEDGNWKKRWDDGTFYESIKPDIIKEYENKYGKESTLRQGDMFCIPFPTQDIDRVNNILRVTLDEELEEQTWDEPRRDRYFNNHLYGTRHWIKGLCCVKGQYVIGKGTLHAPDHADLVLNKMCIIAQTKNLKNAKKAD